VKPEGEPLREGTIVAVVMQRLRGVVGSLVGSSHRRLAHLDPSLAPD
jgi:hypothetical protein